MISAARPLLPPQRIPSGGQPAPVRTAVRRPLPLPGLQDIRRSRAARATARNIARIDPVPFIAVRGFSTGRGQQVIVSEESAIRGGGVLHADGLGDSLLWEELSASQSALQRLNRSTLCAPELRPCPPTPMGVPAQAVEGQLLDEETTAKGTWVSSAAVERRIPASILHTEINVFGGIQGLASASVPATVHTLVPAPAPAPAPSSEIIITAGSTDVEQPGTQSSVPVAALGGGLEVTMGGGHSQAADVSVVEVLEGGTNWDVDSSPLSPRLHSYEDSYACMTPRGLVGMLNPPYLYSLSHYHRKYVGA